MTEAKLFKSGGSQAVRLPKAYRFEGDRVLISRDGHKVILEPIAARPRRSIEDVRAWLADIQALAGERFECPEQPAMQERDWSAFD